MSNADTRTAVTPLKSPGAQPLLLALGFAILMAISAASVWLVNRSYDDSDAVVHTLEVQNVLTQVLLNLRRAESAQRGYLIAGQQSYLDDYREASRNTLPALDSVRTAIADNPAQQAAMARLAPLVREKLTEMDGALALYASGQREEAQARVRAGEGRNLMQNARDLVLGMYETERTLLDQRTAESRRTNQYLLVINLLGSAIILLIGAASIILVRRNNRLREEARTALESAKENLETAVAERTSDLQEANDEIQRFAYIVSHDLRSPLVNIMGFTTEVEALKKDTFEQLAALRQPESEDSKKDMDLSRDFDESFAFIKSSIGKMDRLINSILRLSREGRREFKPEYISMDDLLKSIADSVAHQAPENDSDVIVEPLPPLKSDRLAMEQIFSNLVDNALKYTQPGRAGHVRIRGRSTPINVIYEVEDNGRGIAPEDHKRIFDLFRRAGQQDKAGEGIGLAHVRALVRRLGGFMTLTSASGQGSTFTVTLPRRMSDEERTAA